MGSRYLKTEVESLKRMYPSASEAEILVEVPGRSWMAISKYSRTKLNLHRTKKAIYLAVLAGQAKAKLKEEKIKKQRI